MRPKSSTPRSRRSADAQPMHEMPHWLDSWRVDGAPRISPITGTTKRRRPTTSRPVIRSNVCARYFSAGPCPAPANIAGRLLEPYVEDIAFERLRNRRQPPTARVREAERRAAAAQATLTAYRDSPRLQSVLDEDTFAAGLAVRSRRVRRALLDLAAARARHDAHELAPADEFEALWPTMDLRARHDVIRRVVDCVIVARGKRHVRDRVTVFPIGCGPADLPRRGDKHSPLRRLEALHHDPAAAGRSEPRPWSHTRLLRELHALSRTAHSGRQWRRSWTPDACACTSRSCSRAARLGGPASSACRYAAPPAPLELRRRAHPRCARDLPCRHDRWPTRRQFERDGMGALRVAINRTGGVDRWIDEFGLPRPHRHKGQTKYWTDERIRTELTALCVSRTVFPSRRELQRAGLAGMLLRHAGTPGRRRLGPRARAPAVSPRLRTRQPMSGGERDVRTGRSNAFGLRSRCLDSERLNAMSPNAPPRSAGAATCQAKRRRRLRCLAGGFGHGWGTECSPKHGVISSVLASRPARADMLPRPCWS